MSTHALALRVYWAVFTLLIVLTLVTVGLSFVELGRLHAAVGLSIAVVKGLLVASFFMHVWHSDHLTWLVAGTGLFWLGIMITLTMTDYLTRAWWAY
jgi:cytochrome c oxidase subunit IV